MILNKKIEINESKLRENVHFENFLRGIYCAMQGAYGKDTFYLHTGIVNKSQEVYLVKLFDEFSIEKYINADPECMQLIDFFQAMSEDSQYEKIGFDYVSDEIVEADVEAPFSMFYVYGKNKYDATVQYCFDESIYDEYWVEIFHMHFISAINDALCDMDKPIKELNVVSDFEINIIDKANQTAHPYSDNKCVHQNIEDVSERLPHRIALQYDDKVVTYKELVEKVNALSNFLCEEGVGIGDFVALAAKRSVEAIYAIYAVMKAGAAYVPLSLKSPAERNKYIIEECGAKLILTTEDEMDYLSGVRVINLKDQSIYERSEMAILSSVKPTDIAALVYTSGTTGLPKGVLLRHNTIVNYCEYNLREMPVKEEDIITQFAPLNFSASIYEISTTLFAGAKLCILKDETIADIKEFHKYIAEIKATLILLPPEYANYVTPPDSAKLIETAASLCRNEVSEKIRERTRHLNAYGITEGSIPAVWYGNPDEVHQRVPIGKPVSNSQVFVINKGEICGMYMPGELCVTGLAVSNGYFNLPKLNKERFIENPFGDGMMLRTGDIAQWNYDGNLEYLGRNDNQVQIRGMRVELEEVERSLIKNEQISNASVICREDSSGDNMLVAFVVSSSNIIAADFKEQLKSSLPHYMIPAHIVQLDSLPLTNNGKVNKDILEKIEIQRSMPYSEPKNIIEKDLANIFESILQINSVGRNDNFFELGGHSLRAMKLLNLIELNYSVKLTVREIYEDATIAGIARLIEITPKQEYDRIEKTEEKKYYKMAPAQRRLYVLQEIDDIGTAYNIPAGVRIKGKIDVDKVRVVFQKLIERHKVLRTVFKMKNGEAVQEILTDVDGQVEYEESIGMGEEEQKRVLDDFVRPFDLEKAPLMRLKVVVTGKEESFLLLDIHHIISDGMSMNILMEEFSALYNGNDVGMQELEYCDYSEWINGRDLSSQAEYWKDEFADGGPVLNLITDYPRPQLQSFRGGVTEVRTETALWNEIKQYSRKSGVTEYMVLLSGAYILLEKYSGQEDIVIGSPISGRTHRDTECMLGMFVNTLAMRGYPNKEKRTRDFIAQVKENCLRAYENQEYPFEDLVESVEVRRDISRNPLFDVMLALQNNEKVEMQLNSLKCEELMPEERSTKFDLAININEEEGTYRIEFEYCSDLYRKEMIDVMAGHYLQILNEIVKDDKKTIGEISPLDEKEYATVVERFNNTYMDYPRDKTLVDIIEEQVTKTPNNVAVVYEDEQLTYAQLNARANSLAYILRKEYKVKPDDFVAMITERSLEMIIGIFGIIKAGGAYVPIDPTYPENRIQYMLQDSAPKAVLVYKAEVDTEIPVIDLADSKVWEGAAENLDKVNKATDLVYCIYTSGTTGNPKGVMVENRGINNLNNYFRHVMNIHNYNTVGSFHNYIFDGSVFDMMMGLLSGLKLVVLSEEQIYNLNELKEAIKNNKIDTIVLPPQYATQLKTDVKYINTLITAGAEAKSELLENIEKKYINAYGPTENTILATYWEYEKGDILPVIIPIGKPSPNICIYILSGKEICGIGVPGELCIAGDSVARGYLNQPELTAEKFVKNPYGEGMMYRSGDLARWLPDGNVEYLGRIDQQVKIRGFRIELGEIESKLNEMEEINEAAVVVKEDNSGDKYLCAYVVSDKEIKTNGVKDILRKNLPDYMIPSYIMQIDFLPVTRSGKLDKRALPDPEYVNVNEYVAPRNSTEATIVKAFEEVLGVERVSVTDNFFDLGGDSIKAIRIVSKVREEGYSVSVKDLMSEKTPEDIAKETKKDLIAINAEQGEVNGEAALTAIQEEFFKYKLLNPNHFNQSMIYECTERIEKSVLDKVLLKITEHHDILRATYKDGLQVIGKIEERKWYSLSEYECSVEEIDKLSNELQSSIDIETGPLMKAGLFSTPEKDYVLLIIHHLAVDGVSWRIINEDLEKGYKQGKQGKAIVLPRKTTSFKEWSDGVARYRNSYKLKKEIGYWNKVNKKIRDGKILKDGDKEDSKLETVEIVVEREYTEALLRNSNKAYNTEINDLLLTALVRAVNKVMGQSTVAVEMEGHGREEISEELNIERTVGWFTSTYPVVFENVGKELGQDIRNNKETLHRVPNKGIGYSILKNVGEVGLGRDVKPDITFNYLGEFEEGQGDNNSVFRLSNIRHGSDINMANRFGTSISINGAVESGILSIRLSCDEKEYKTVKRLCEEFKQEVIAVIEHCQNVETVEYTASDFGEYEWSDDEFKTVKAKIESMGQEIKRIYPLTAMQEGLLYEKLANEESTLNVIQQVTKSKKLNIENLQIAFEALVDKHEILRTIIKYRGVNIPRQVLLKERKPKFTYIEVDSEEEYRKIKEKDVKRGFDLEYDTLIRITVVKVSKEDYRMIITTHHIIEDGWCISIINGDLFRYYILLERGEGIPKESTGSFEEFVKSLEERDKTEGLKYWEHLLEGYEKEANILPIGTPDITEDENIRINISLSEETTQKAERLSARCGVTVNTIIEAVWGIVLQKYNRTNDVVFAKVVSGRNAKVKDIEQMVGLFINTIPMRVKTEENDTFDILIDKLQKQAIASGNYDYCPLVEVQNKSKLGNCLTDTIMVFENYYVHVMELGEELEGEFESSREQVGFGITLSVDISKTLNMGIEYETDKYGRKEIELLLERLKRLTENAINNPEIRIGDLQMIDDSEEGRIVKEFNNTVVDHPGDKTVAELFEEEATPNNAEYVDVNEFVTPRNSTEAAIVKAFEEVLDVERVSVTDSFFDLGGDSIKAVRIVLLLDDICIDVRAILSGQTPERIAYNKPFSFKNQLMFIMNQSLAYNDLKPRIFMIPPAGGNAFEFNMLVKELQYDGFIYGINDPKLYISNIQDLKDSNEYTVSKIFERISEVFRDGDILVGYSYGGKLLPSITKRLEDAGKKVGKIFVLDTMINVPLAIIPKNEKEEQKIIYRNIAKVFIKKILGRSYSDAEIGDTTDEILRKVTWILSNNSNKNYKKMYSEVKRFLDVYYINCLYDVKFASKMEAEVIAVFTNNSIKMNPDKCHEWGKYTDGDYKYYSIDYTHDSLVTLGAKEVAFLIKNTLTKLF